MAKIKFDTSAGDTFGKVAADRLLYFNFGEMIGTDSCDVAMNNSYQQRTDQFYVMVETDDNDTPIYV